MSVRELSSYIFTGKYANDIRALRRRETRDEARRRMFDMHRDHYLTGDVPKGCVSAAVPESRAAALAELIYEAETAFADGLALGSQRVLQYAGAPVLSKNARAYNCCFSFADRPRFFQEAFHLLLCGSGTGFSVQRHHVARLPAIKRPAADSESKTFLIPDTIEGWADALGVLLSSYFDSDDTPFPGYRGKIVEFSYILIRAEGSPLSTNTGKAPGPEPLRASLEKIRDLLDRCCVTSKHGKLEPIDVYDVVMHASDAVLAGGVRRSASICLFSVDDMDMARAKTGNWFSENPQRGRSNNSALLLRGSTSYEQYKQLVDWSREWGEPGVVWSDSTEMGVNPCVEASFWPVCVETGESGWQFCVAGDTRLITKSGVINIADAVGKKIEIWNGVEWSEVEPYETGRGRKLYRVSFSDGSFVDVTDNHRFAVSMSIDGVFCEMTTSQISDAMADGKRMTIPRANVSYASGGVVIRNAYEIGFSVGDGCVHVEEKRIRVVADLFGDKIDLPLIGKRAQSRLKNGYSSHSQWIEIDADPEIVSSIKNHEGIPGAVFAWSRDSIIDFVSGLIDADGSQANRGCRVYGSEHKMRDLQLLLTKVGVNSSVNFMTDEDSNLGERRIPMWYVQIPNASSLKSYRLDLSSGREPSGKGRVQVIRSVVDLDGVHDTFCLTDPKRGMCVFNNALTYQCNLSLGNMSAVKSMDDARRAIRAATIMGTLQAGYTSFPYLGPVSERITRREALLGVSMTGMAERPDIAFDAESLRELAQVVRDTNAEVSALLDINVAARSTCIKPEGTSTGMLGALGSGVHDVHAPRTIRHVQANRNEVQAKYFAIHNPHAVEASVWKDRDVILSFALEAPAHAAFKAQTSALDMLRRVKLVKENWVDAGRRVELCTQPWISHNVSNTVVVRDSEWDGVTNFIYENRDVFAGVSLLADGGDLDYPQAPFVEVLDPVEILSAFGRWEDSDYELVDDSRNGFRDLWDAVDTVTAPASELQESVRAHWKSRFSALVNSDFGGDRRRAGHYLKSLHYWRRWQDLTTKTVAVDYEKMVEDESGVDFGQIVACAGGACQVL